MKAIILENDIELRLLSESDANELFLVVNACRPYLSEWLPWVKEAKFEKDTLDFILSRKRAYREGKGLSCTIRQKKQIVGIIGFNIIVASSRSAEIGYWLAEKVQGRGLMRRSCEALVAYGFESLNLNRIVIRCAELNVKSCAIPEHLGFVFEGTLRESAKIGGQFHSMRLYSKLASEHL